MPITKLIANAQGDGLNSTGTDIRDSVNALIDYSETALTEIDITDLDKYTQAEVNALLANYATSAQGALADSATQPTDNISTLTNDSNFLPGVNGINSIEVVAAFPGTPTTGVLYIKV